MASDYLLQVVHRTTGEVATSWAPGSKAEVDFIEAVTNRVGLKRVGVATTSGTVMLKVREALEEEIFKLKQKVRPEGF